MILYVIAIIGGLVVALYATCAIVLLREALEGRRERKREETDELTGLREALQVAAREWGE